MATLELLPDRKQIAIAADESLLSASLRAGIPHAHACGGNARCSTCRVVVVEGAENCSPRNAHEQELASRLHFTPEIRLACQTTASGDVKVRRLILDTEDLELTLQLAAGRAPAPIGQERETGNPF